MDPWQRGHIVVSEGAQLVENWWREDIEDAQEWDLVDRFVCALDLALVVLE